MREVSRACYAGTRAGAFDLQELLALHNDEGLTNHIAGRGRAKLQARSRMLLWGDAWCWAVRTGEEVRRAGFELGLSWA